MSKPINLEVTLEECKGSVDRMIKRFLKKFKKQKLSDEFKKHMSYDKPSDIRREKKKRRKQILKRLQQERDNGSSYKKRDK